MKTLPVKTLPGFYIMAPVLMLLGGCSGADHSYTGYVEAQSVAISAPQSGWLKTVYVDRGSQITLDQTLFALDDTQAQAQLAGSQSRADAAKAQATDLSKGAREADIAPLVQERAQAQASLDLARANQARYEPLFAKGYASAAQMDNLRATTKSAEAALQNIDKTIEEKRLAAREDQLAAAKAQAQASGADVAATQWSVDDRLVKARLTGRVDERLREPGEFIAAGTAILTVIPQGRQFVRFYVPQSALGRFRIGQGVSIACDGCKTQGAKIRFIAHESEFTPPVIYSVKERQKLMFLIEATPADPDALHTGQPVDVSL